jgi:hypothetical protein
VAERTARERALDLFRKWSGAPTRYAVTRAIQAAILDERAACRALLIEMATADGVDWFSGEVLREAERRIRARSTEGDK